MMRTNWLTSPLAEALGWTLIHALWQGFAVVLTVALLFHLTRQSRAALRYQLGMGGLLMQVLASVGTFGWYYEPRSVATVATAVGPTINAHSGLVATADTAWLMQTQGFLATHLTQIVWLWLVGVAVFGIRLVGGWAYVQRLRTTATLPVATALLDATARMARTMNVSVRVQVTARVTGPLVVGVLKPVVLWPVGLLAGLSMADVEAVLAHELAHVRRHDYLFNMAQSVVEVLYFFHPALWWLSARVREEREHCCDDLAVAVIGDARTLARALALVEAWQQDAQQTPTLAMAFASKRQLLLQRVRRMLGVPTRPLVSNGSLAGLTLATILLLSVSVYAVQRADEPKPASRSTNPMPPKANRRYRVNSNTEYGLTNSGRMSYVVWKGQKLPATRVTKLQRELDLVMGGKLNLDAVKQPDHDILLTIIEKNVAFDAGMKALSDGMAQIDYSNIDVKKESGAKAASADVLEAQPANRPDSVPAMAGDTAQLRAVKLKMEALTNEMQKVMAERQPLANRLSKEMAELAAKNANRYRQKGMNLSQIGQLMRQQNALMVRMGPLNTELRRLSRLNTEQAAILLRKREAEANQLEKQIDVLATQMDRLNTQADGPLADAYQNRIEAITDSISTLYEPINALSDELAKLSEQFAEQVEKQTAEAMQKAEEAMDRMDTGDRPARAPRAPRRPASPPRLPRPAVAPRATRPAVEVPVPVVVPVPAPTPVPAPAAAPKPVRAPKPPKE